MYLLPYHITPELSWHLIGVEPVSDSYEAARRRCISHVRAAAAECRRTNVMFSDAHFDIENDLSADQNCLYGLGRDWLEKSLDEDNISSSANANLKSKALPKMRRKKRVHSQLDVSTYPFDPPKSVHRVSWIFEKPQFITENTSGYGVKQGASGNCWWIAAVTSIAHRRDIMGRICVARDEMCGIYGFVFHKDGGWISTVVDDYLYLSESDFNCDDEVYDPTGEKARFHKDQKQSNSKALHFAKCTNRNETWLPLLEKAYAKVHGDYEALNGGWLLRPDPAKVRTPDKVRTRGPIRKGSLVQYTLDGSQP